MLDVMEDCRIAIFFLMRLPTSRCVVLCTGIKCHPTFSSFFFGFKISKNRYIVPSDGVDEYAVKKFLCQIFSNTNSSGKICSIIKESASRKFDIKEEVLPFPFK